MEWNTFWTAVGSIGQWAGAIGTIWAVRVALNSGKPSVKVNASIAIDPHSSQNYINFSAVNMGSLPLQLVSSGLLLGGGKRATFIHETQNIFPAYLQPSESVSYYVDIRKVAKVLENAGLKGRVKAKIVFTDASGKAFYGQLKLTTTNWP